MEQTNKMIFSIFLIVAMIWLLGTFSYAGTQTWNALDYDVTLNEDGSMNVVETWNVDISETNTLFKDFEIDIYDDYKIENVKVSQVVNGQEITLKQIYEEQYHVDSGCYYGLQIDSYTYEIAWNVGLDNSSGSRIYKIYYTVENAVAIHNDCTELYWQFLSDENTMTGDNITGTIRLPKSVSSIEKFRVWGHGPLEAVINKVSVNKASIYLDSISSNQMLEVRIVTEENIYEKSTNFTNKYKLESILTEEKGWADEANKQREEAKKIWNNILVTIAILVIINIIVLILFLKINKKYKDVGVELKEKYYYEKKDLQYYRDIPNEENATPARASYFYGFKNNNVYMKASISKIFSATMLDLALKGLIEFQTINEEVQIYLKHNIEDKTENLFEDEKIIYDLLKDAMENKESITPKEFSKYASLNYEMVYTRLNRIQSIVESDLKNINKISTERQNIHKKWKSKFLVFLILALVLSSVVSFFLPAIPLGLAIIAFSCVKNASYVSILSEIGNEEEKQWKALKKYMEEYSMLDEKLVPDIILWEKYLVYATAFGISKKVIQQLKVVHPEMFYEENGNYINQYAYWHMINHTTFGKNSFYDFSKSLEKVYNSAQSAYNVAHSSSSSGSGGGGGFSGGGGGRWRRW